MIELVFTLALGLVMLGVAMPTLALLSKGVLRIWRSNAPLRGALVPYTLLVLPTLLPLLWLAVFSVIPVFGGRQGTQTDLLFKLCPGALGWLVLGLGICASVIGWRVKKTQSHLQTLRPVPSDHPAWSRLERLSQGNPALQKVCLRLVTGAHHQVFTRGFSQREVWMSAAFVQQLNDDELKAALLHEVEHFRGHDPLRNALLEACLTLNPLGRLLRKEASQWHLTREIHCDRQAVIDGASPLSLADALMSVARPCSSRCGCISIAALGGPALRGIDLRVRLLISYLDSPPRNMSIWGQGMVMAVMFLVTGLPTLLAGPGLFEQLHLFAEWLVKSLFS